MKNTQLHKVCRRLLPALSLTALAAIVLPGQSSAQLKIGDNPHVLTPSAILELNSTQQGLLLPRLTDWTINTTFSSSGIPDGMMIYFDSPGGATDSASGVYIRKDAAWVRVTDFSESSSMLWGREGNTVTGANNILGTLNQEDLRIFTNNALRLRITGTGAGNEAAHFSVDSVSMEGSLRISDSLRVGDTIRTAGINISDLAVVQNELFLKGVTAGAFDSILVIDADGKVHLRELDPTTFKHWTIGDFDPSGNAQGLERRAGPTATDPDSLIMHAATATTPGGVSVAAQEFAGAKTFKDPVLVSTAGTAANSTLHVDGSIALAALSVSADLTLTDAHHTIFAAANGSTLTLPDPTTLSGRIYVIKKSAATDFGSPVIILGHVEGVNNTSVNVYNSGTTFKFQSDGSTWRVIM